MSETPVQVPGPEMAPAPPPAPQSFTERLSDSLQHWIGIIVGSQRKPPRRLKSLLNGTWLGHPLHPVMTDVPITAWMLAAVFDIIWLIAHPTWAAYGAFVTVIVGLFGAFGAIVTGLPIGAIPTVLNDALASIMPSSMRAPRSSTSSPLSCASSLVRGMASRPSFLASWG